MEKVEGDTGFESFVYRFFRHLFLFLFCFVSKERNLFPSSAVVLIPKTTKNKTPSTYTHKTTQQQQQQQQQQHHTTTTTTMSDIDSSSDEDDLMFGERRSLLAPEPVNNFFLQPAKSARHPSRRVKTSAPTQTLCHSCRGSCFRRKSLITVRVSLAHPSEEMRTSSLRETAGTACDILPTNYREVSANGSLQ